MSPCGTLIYTTSPPCRRATMPTTSASGAQRRRSWLGRVRPFIRKLVDLLDAFAQSVEQRPAPSARNEGCGVLVDLLVGLSEELGFRLPRLGILPNRDPKIDFPRTAGLIHGIETQLSQIIAGLQLGEGPLLHGYAPRPPGRLRRISNSGLRRWR